FDENLFSREVGWAMTTALVLPGGLWLAALGYHSFYIAGDGLDFRSGISKSLKLTIRAPGRPLLLSWGGLAVNGWLAAKALPGVFLAYPLWILGTSELFHALLKEEAMKNDK